MPRPKSNKPKVPFLQRYKTYNPEIEGYGNPEQWRDIFFERLGFEKAVEVLGEDDPMFLFGLDAKATWNDVLASYRKLSKEWHPDLNGHRLEEALVRMKKINAAFEVLENRFGK